MKCDHIITCNKKILGGTPVFKGTRVPIKSLVDHLKAGDSLEDFLGGFPSVSREQAQVFLDLAQESLLKEIEYAHFDKENFKDLLELAGQVYDGLTDDEIDEIEKVATERRDFFGESLK